MLIVAAARLATNGGCQCSRRRTSAGIQRRSTSAIEWTALRSDLDCLFNLGYVTVDRRSAMSRTFVHAVLNVVTGWVGLFGWPLPAGKTYHSGLHSPRRSSPARRPQIPS